MLPRWGGTLDFNLDTYTEWRASEEGIDAERLCKRGAGRAFDVKAAAAAQAAALAAASGSDDPMVSRIPTALGGFPLRCLYLSVYLSVPLDSLSHLRLSCLPPLPSLR